MMVASAMSVLDYLFTYATVFGVVAASAFAVYAFFYLHGAKARRDYGRVLDFAFAVSLLNFIAMIALSGSLSKIAALYSVSVLLPLLFGAFIAIATVCSLFVFAYFFRGLRLDSNRRAIMMVAILVAISLMAYLMITTVVDHYRVDDEIFIGIKSVGYLLNGINPYQRSVAQQLYYNASKTGFTFTTNDQIMGTLSYPALYLFAYLPFYLMMPMTLHGVEYYIAPLQDATFFAVMLFAIAFCVDRESLKRPPYGLLLSLAFIFVLKAAMVDYLMIALLVLAYKGMGKRYSWVLLGMCLAIQELAWLSVVLLLAYSFNNYGIKKGIKDIVGSVSVFLAINSYFIILSPSAFFGDIFNPLQKLLMPIGTSSLLGFFMLANYHVLLGTNTVVFGIVSLLMVMAYLYTNKKAMLGLLSMIPLFFLAHALSCYYAVFLVLIFTAMLIEDKKHDAGIIGSYLRKNRALFWFVVSALLLSLIATVCISHAGYLRGFDLSVSNQSMHYSASPNETVYTGTLSYNSLSVNSVYLLLYGYWGHEEGEIGMLNYSLINGSVRCGSGDIQCMVNVNKIDLSNGTGTYKIIARIPCGNPSESVADARLMLYNGEYFYIAPAVSNASISDP
jgi:hypothetical protein